MDLNPTPPSQTCRFEHTQPKEGSIAGKDIIQHDAKKPPSRSEIYKQKQKLIAGTKANANRLKQINIYEKNITEVVTHRQDS